MKRSPNRFRKFLILGQLVLGATSCTVYAPMQGTMPLITAKGQAEFGASIQPIGRVEATAAYSPAKHLLLTAGVTGCPKLGTKNFLVTRQYEVGAGSYQKLGAHWLLSGLAGYGQAVTNRGHKVISISVTEYNARYNKLFAQLGIAHTGDKSSVGLTYRLVQVRFSALTDTQAGPLPLPQMLRHELLLFNRSRWMGSKGEWSFINAAGLSVSSTPKRDNDLGPPTYGAAEYEANRNLLPALFWSFGVVYQPNWAAINQ